MGQTIHRHVISFPLSFFLSFSFSVLLSSAFSGCDCLFIAGANNRANTFTKSTAFTRRIHTMGLFKSSQILAIYSLRWHALTGPVQNSLNTDCIHIPSWLNIVVPSLDSVGLETQSETLISLPQQPQDVWQQRITAPLSARNDSFPPRHPSGFRPRPRY